MSELTARQQWKIFWRALRVARREARKAANDLVMYGMGVVEVRHDADPRHIPLSEMLNHG